MSYEAVEMGEVDVDGFPIVERRMLPMEMLERIFMLLPPKDLKTVMFVCKRWKEAGSVPKLWSWVVLKLNYNAYRCLPSVLATEENKKNLLSSGWR